MKIKPQSGFSLIELMISITLSSLIMLALIATFVNITRSNNELARTNIQIENGRFAMQFLQNDLVHAGFWGNHIPQFDDLTCTPFTCPTSDAPTAVPDICLAYTSWDAVVKTNLIGIPVQSYAFPTTCTSLLPNQKAGTDILVVRHAETCVAGAVGCEADTAGKLYFQSSLCQPPLLNTMNPDAAAYTLGTSDFNTLHQRGCATPVTEKRKFISNIYYIRDYASTAGDGIPTLVRSQFDLSAGVLAQQPPVALIEGIEGFIVELGIDNISDNGTDIFNDADLTNRYTAAIIKWANPANLTSPTNRGDGNADGNFVHCSAAACSAAQLSNVVAVKLYVLARAREESLGTLSYSTNKTYQLGTSSTLGPFADHYKRHVFATSVRLTNISGRRETP